MKISSKLKMTYARILLTVLILLFPITGIASFLYNRMIFTYYMDGVVAFGVLCLFGGLIKLIWDNEDV